MLHDLGSIRIPSNSLDSLNIHFHPLPPKPHLPELRHGPDAGETGHLGDMKPKLPFHRRAIHRRSTCGETKSVKAWRRETLQPKSDGLLPNSEGKKGKMHEVSEETTPTY